MQGMLEIDILSSGELRISRKDAALNGLLLNLLLECDCDTKDIKQFLDDGNAVEILLGERLCG